MMNARTSRLCFYLTLWAIIGTVLQHSCTAHYYEGQRAQIHCPSAFPLKPATKWFKLGYSGPDQVTLLTPVCVVSDEPPCPEQGLSIHPATGDLMVESLALQHTGRYRCDTTDGAAETRLHVYEKPRITMDPRYTWATNGRLRITWDVVHGATSPITSIHIAYTITSGEGAPEHQHIMHHEIFPRGKGDALVTTGDIYLTGCSHTQVYKVTVTALDDTGPIEGFSETFAFGCPLGVASQEVRLPLSTPSNDTIVTEGLHSPAVRHDVLLAICIGMGLAALVGTVVFVACHVKRSGASKAVVDSRARANSRVRITVLPTRGNLPGEPVTRVNLCPKPLCPPPTTQRHEAPRSPSTARSQTTRTPNSCSTDQRPNPDSRRARLFKFTPQKDSPLALA